MIYTPEGARGPRRISFSSATATANRFAIGWETLRSEDACRPEIATDISGYQAIGPARPLTFANAVREPICLAQVRHDLTVNLDL